MPSQSLSTEIRKCGSQSRPFWSRKPRVTIVAVVPFPAERRASLAARFYMREESAAPSRSLISGRLRGTPGSDATACGRSEAALVPAAA